MGHGESEPAPAGMERADIMAWRKSERARLIESRLAATAAEREVWSAAIAAALEAIAGDVRDRIVSLYWPFRGEPDLRPWMHRIERQGGVCALPVVIEKGRPLVFRVWREGEPLARGVWNIPVPATGPEVVPDIVIAPVVGFDPDNYRLGYGGGFFDRTLAALPAKPPVIGVGYALQAIATIHPLAHDIPMDAIVTEKGVMARGAGR